MRYILVGFLLFMMFCTSDKADLAVVSTSAALFDTPSPYGKVLTPLTPGAGLKALGEVSRWETALVENGTNTVLPWLRVETPDGQKGWVWMGWVRPTESDSAAWVQSRRMACYLGPKVFEQYQKRQRSGVALPDAVNFRQTMKLRDSMMHALHHRAEAGWASPADDWTWLTRAMPGFVFQRMDDGRRPYLFADYGYWLAEARQTPDTEDDVFFETMCAMFAADSIESLFPVWTIQTDLQTGCSQLGLGRHDAMLRALDAAWEACPSYRPEITEAKTRLLGDVLNSGVCYWQNEKKILTELNLIIKNNYSILSNHDKLAIKTRMTMFETPEANGIRVNLRAGE